MFDAPPFQAILHNAESYTAIAVFVATYLFIAVGKLPGYHLDRAGAALLRSASRRTQFRHVANQSALLASLPAFARQ